MSAGMQSPPPHDMATHDVVVEVRERRAARRLVARRSGQRRRRHLAHDDVELVGARRLQDRGGRQRVAAAAPRDRGEPRVHVPLGVVRHRDAGVRGRPGGGGGVGHREPDQRRVAVVQRAADVPPGLRPVDLETRHAGGFPLGVRDLDLDHAAAAERGQRRRRQRDPARLQHSAQRVAVGGVTRPCPTGAPGRSSHGRRFPQAS